MSPRVLAAAAFSVLIHAALVVPLLRGRDDRRAPVPTEIAEVEVQVLPSPRGEGARSAGEGPAERQAHSVPEKRRPKIVSAPAIPAVDETPGSTEIAAPEVFEAAPPRLDEAPSPSAAPSTALRAPSPQEEGSLERELHAKLQASAARCYPSASHRFHETGVSEVGFCVSDSGALGGGKLSRSSGSERLDRAALDCVVGTTEAFPAAKGRCFSLPVKFGD